MARRRVVPVSWTASRSGVRHGFQGRRSRTLCGISVNEQWTRPEMPKCPVCVAREQEEATGRKS